MLVGNYMTPKPVTIRPESDFLAAIAIIKAGRFRSLPVVNEQGEPVGIVTDKDLAVASPAVIDQIRTREPDYYGVHLRVEQVMNPDFVSVPPVVPLEEAALVMLKKRVDRLLIVEQGKLVGIITSSDIFRSLVTILGGGSSALRLTIEIDNTPGQLAKLAGDVASLGGNIISIATAHSTQERWAMVLRIEKVDWKQLKTLLDIRPEYKILHVCGENGTCEYNP